MYTYWETSGVSINVNQLHLFSKLGQMCNLGMLHRYNTGISSVYESTLTADKALNVLYSNYREDCAGTTEIGSYQNAWWHVTFKSLSTIFKINLIFREKCKFSQICKFQKTNYFRRYLGDGLRGRGLPTCFHVCIPIFESIYSINAPIFQI